VSTTRAAAIPILLALGLAGCAALPLAPVPQASSVTPQAASEQPPEGLQLWGGVLVSVENHADFSRLEVVGYPLRRQEPQPGASTEGRFWVEYPGFLDPIEYRPGRRLSARGLVDRIEWGRIGEADYAYPVLRADSVHLWPDAAAGSPPERVRFSIGIGFGR
jgi:outer membrane lipoprotein